MIDDRKARNARVLEARARWRAVLAEITGAAPQDGQRVRATAAQEYFWSLTRLDPDPAAYAMQMVSRIDGPLDRELFRRSVEEVVARHTVFRTVLTESDSAVFQEISSTAPRFELGLADVSPRDESAWLDEVENIAASLVGQLDLAAGRTLCARLTTLAPDRHLFVLVIHHVAADGASCSALKREIFARFEALQHGAVIDETRPPQFIDYAETLARFAATPLGIAQQAWWRDKLDGAAPLCLPTDVPRAEHDAKRAAAPRGVTPDRMHFPYLNRELPAAARAHVLRTARDVRTTAYSVYLGAYAWLLHEVAGQDDICIENSFTLRTQHRDLEKVQGPVTTWTMMRIDVGGCETAKAAIGRAAEVFAEVTEHGLIHDYYDTVPSTIRRAVLNYVQSSGAPKLDVTGVDIVDYPRAFPVWKRPWELHLTIRDLGHTSYLIWTGSEALFRRETVEALLERYVAILEHDLA